MDDTDPANQTQYTQQTYEQMAKSKFIRKLLLPKALVNNPPKKQRGIAFTFGSICSWCISEKNDFFNPSINQIAARTGISARSVTEHLPYLEEYGWITRKSRHKQNSFTLVTPEGRAIFHSPYSKYLEVPVALIQDMNSHRINSERFNPYTGEYDPIELPAIPLIPRFVMCVMFNRLAMEIRLKERNHCADTEPSEHKIKSVAKELYVPKYRLAEAARLLETMGYLTVLDDETVMLDPNGSIAYPHNHDTRIDKCIH